MALDLLPEIDSNVAVERNIAQRFAGASTPAAVIPWPDTGSCNFSCRIFPAERKSSSARRNLPGPTTGHVQVGHGRLVQRIRHRVAPEFVVAAVTDELVQVGIFRGKFFISVGKRAQTRYLEHVETIKRKTEILAGAFQKRSVLDPYVSRNAPL